MTRRDTFLLACGFAVLAWLARLPGLGRSPWYDELFTVVHFTGSLSEACGRQVGANNHPLASVLVWGMRGLGSASAAGLRAPFLILGGLAVPALWAQRRLIGSRAALFASALAVLAPWHVAYAQQLRGYAGVLLVAALLPGLLDRSLRRDPPTACRVGLALTAALGVTAHASVGILVVLGLLLALASSSLGWAARGDARRAATWLGGGLALGCLALAPVAGKTWKHAGRMLVDGDAGAVGRLGLGDLLEVLGDGQPWLAVALAAAAAGGVWRLGRRSPRALALVAAPLVAASLLVVLRAPAYARFLLLGLPALLVLAGVGLAGLPRRASLVALALLLVGSAGRVATRAQEEWQDYAGVARLLHEQAPTLQPLAVRRGSGRLLGAVCDPAPVEPSDLLALEAWLAQPGLGVAVDDFPALTDPARRSRLRARCGAPWLLPGRVSPVAIYWRSP